MTHRCYSITFISLLTVISAFGQGANTDLFSHSQELNGITDTWHRIELPDDLYQHTRADLGDIRIYGINTEGKTIEAPYLLDIQRPQTSLKNHEATIIDKSHNNNGYYYTLKIEDERLLNQIQLQSALDNYDWVIKLEGSYNQKEWFTIKEKSRILSIKNNMTDYSFNIIPFDDSKYLFYRVTIPATKDPEITNIMTAKSVENKMTYLAYNNKKFSNTIDKYNDNLIEFSLPTAVPISNIHIHVKDKFDYYRPIEISYLRDSVQTQKGWIKRYNKMYRGTLSSLEEGVFYCPSITASHFKIKIKNDDNQPLEIENVNVKGTATYLKARFTQKANYALHYGQPSTYAPSYDLSVFKDKIPIELTPLTLGPIILKKDKAKTFALLDNKIYLWRVMFFIIVCLGWFSYKMIKNVAEDESKQEELN